jgi:hypothetical protein
MVVSYGLACIHKARFYLTDRLAYPTRSCFPMINFSFSSARETLLIELSVSHGRGVEGSIDSPIVHLANLTLIL